MIEVTDNQKTELNFALLTLTNVNAVKCEYFSEYPELVIRRLAQTQFSNLVKEGIHGYALCTYRGVWSVIQFRSLDNSSRTVLNDYIKANLNNYYRKGVTIKNVTRGED